MFIYPWWMTHFIFCDLEQKELFDFFPIFFSSDKKEFMLLS
jgi:hypothetical protein